MNDCTLSQICILLMENNMVSSWAWNSDNICVFISSVHVPEGVPQ